ncbi:11331_t:CDS:2 [Funneliformis mosseae]|uniref:11331_t:CDS:1 n=1 Tax=Funneliformis mosseae TaxID=27381 RepID=A0A9N9GEU0_FUNMO|nr:11331_t:CDS:2 [Funneliformis mosseae]
MDEAIINEELLLLIINFLNADFLSENTRAAYTVRLAALDTKNNELQLQDNKYSFVKELEKFSYEEDDNFSNKSLINKEDKDTVMSLNEENTNCEINNIIGFDKK